MALAVEPVMIMIWIIDFLPLNKMIESESLFGSLFLLEKLC